MNPDNTHSQNSAPISLGRIPREVLVQGRWSKADVYRLCFKDTDAVLKDYNRKNLLVRWLGRYQLRKESRAYRRLSGLPGIPRFIERPDSYSLLLEYVDGRRLGECLGPEYDVEDLFRQLRETIRAMHAKGVTHNDLRCRENILVRAGDSQIQLIDFSGAMFFPEGSLRRNILFPLFRLVDTGAYLKWKAAYIPEHITSVERRRLNRINRLRRLWIFNRKGY